MLDDAYRLAARAALDRHRGAPMQERLRAAAPHWVGAVYWNPQEVDHDVLLGELQRMRDAGFTFVRFHAIDPLELDGGDYDFSYTDIRFAAAAEAGLAIHPHLGLHKPNAAVLRRHRLAPADAARLGMSDKRVEEAVAARVGALVGRYRSHPAMRGGAWPLQGEPAAASLPLDGEADEAAFLAWLRSRYPTPEHVHRAWAIYPRVGAGFACEQGRDALRISRWEDAVRLARSLRPGTAGAPLAATALAHEMHGVRRDLCRFRADRTAAETSALVAMIRRSDPDHPIIDGVHQLFYNNPQLGWDNHGMGRLSDGNYASIHPSWHFEAVRGEIDRPAYMQARLANDAAKGGYSNAYETTGGAVQYSGGYGNHMDAGLMRRLMVSYLAAGNEGIAFWSWNHRPGGIEAGEYGLTTYSGRVGAWAREAGRVSRAMGRLREEIWQAVSEPQVGILRSWDTEAALLSEPERFDLQDGPSPWSRGSAQQHIRGLIGAWRTALDHQLCYQTIDEGELLAGIAGLYPVLYLPHVRAIGDDVLEKLLEYVEHGGHLVADVQIGFADPWGKMRRPGPGTLIERIFGGWVDMIHDARTCCQAVDGIGVKGFYGDLVATRARTIKRFADGRPAVIDAAHGRGRATLIGFDAARQCCAPGDGACEGLLADLMRAGSPRRWICDAPLCWRRACPAADHYFIVNDGDAPRTAHLRVFDRVYASGEDVLEERPLDGQDPIAVDIAPRSAAWIRMALG